MIDATHIPNRALEHPIATMSGSAGQTVDTLPQAYNAPQAGCSSALQQPRTTNPSPSTFPWPAYTSFPPFYTLQPNTATRTRQLELWSSLITTYSAFHRLFRLTLSSPPPDLFANPTLSRSLKPADVRTLLSHMSSPAGGQTIEFIPPASKTEQSNAVYVWWKSASEWADLLYAWVDETGQKGAVLTVYELRDGEGVGGREWVGMDEGMLMKVLAVLVKRGKAQIFGEGGGEGVKFF